MAIRRMGRPLLLGESELMLRHTTDVMAAALESPNWPTASSRVPDEPPELQGVWSKLRHMPADLLMPSYRRRVRRDYEVNARRRLAATTLAARWYAADHGGALPVRLADLVPSYLPCVPTDPLAITGKPLGYVADPDRPRVYSVGENGVDDGGRDPDPILPRSERVRIADDVRYLKRQPRPAQEVGGK